MQSIAMTADEQAPIDVLPDDGGTISNQRARQRLGWDDDQYFAVRNAVVGAGIAEVGRGRGGTVRRLMDDVGDPWWRPIWGVNGRRA